MVGELSALGQMSSGDGYLFSSAGSDQLQIQARRDFLEGAMDVIPEAFDALRETVLPAYVATADFALGDARRGVGPDISSAWLARRDLRGMLQFALDLHRTNLPDGEPEWPRSASPLDAPLDPVVIQILQLQRPARKRPARLVPLSYLVPETERHLLLQALRGLSVRLGKWALHFNLNANWIINEALATLRYWGAGYDEPWIHTRLTDRLDREPFEQDSREWIRIHLPAWDFRYGETRRRAEARMKAESARLIEEHLDDVELGNAPGASRGKLQRPVGPTEIAWLVLYQCGGEKQSRIAQKFRVDAAEVSRGIRAAQRLVGIQLVEGRKREREFKGRVADQQKRFG